MRVSTLIGRQHQAGVLRDEVDRCLSGGGGVTLLTGDAGAGKTALADETAGYARLAGARVLGGACWPGAPDYWPWRQVLRKLGGGPAPPWARGGFAICEAVTATLLAAATTRPLLVVLEDLHCADPASVTLLEFVARHARFDPLLVLATCRDTEAERAGHPLAAPLRSLRATTGSVPVPGLEPAEVAALVERAAGLRPSPEVVAGLHRRTGGNPSAVHDVLRGLTGRRGKALAALEAGMARHRAGEPDEARRAFATVVTLAHELGDDELLARTALTVHGLSHPTRREPFEGDVVEQAHRRLVRGGAGEPAPFDRAVGELGRHTATLARRGHDDEVLRLSLLARHDAIMGPATVAERLAIADDLAGLALRTDDPGVGFRAARLRTTALLELGDPRCLAGLERLAGLDGPRFETCWTRATFATLRGDFTLARNLIAELAAIERTDLDSASVARHLLWSVHLTQGRTDDAAAVLAEMERDGHPCPELVAAATAAHRGDAEAALPLLSGTQDTPEGHPGLFAPLLLRVYAEAAAATRDPGLCRRARSAIEPFRGQWAVTAAATVDGPMVYWLAVLDAAEGRGDDAVTGFTAAWRAAERLGARPWSVLARLRLAEAMLAGGGRAAEAGALLDGARTDAAALGMSQAEGPVHRDPPPANEFRLAGAVWTLRFRGRTVHLPDAKGLRDLHQLLRCPGQDVPAVRLLDPAGGEVVVAASGFGGDPVLDRRAAADYRRRLGELDERIAEAVELGDDDRAAALDRERQALLDGLRAATGAGGRPRRLGDQAERARKAVSARVHDTLRKLDRHHPELAEHLRATVSTGAVCRYRPVTPIRWKLAARAGEAAAGAVTGRHLD